MKKIFLFLTLFAAANAMAQTGNAIFFTEKGERFYVVLNGIKYNNMAQTNVKVPGLTAAPYSTTIVFEDTANGIITDKIWVENNLEKNYVIKLRSISESEKTIKKIGSNLNPLTSQNTADKQKQEIANKNSKYVIKQISQTPLAPPPAPAQQQQQVQQAPPQNRSSVNASGTAGSSQTTTTTTQVTSTAPANSANVSMNINVSGNMAETNAYHQEQTTTTTQTTTNHYVMPGYNGPVGCPWPMQDADYRQAKNTISSKTFEDSRFQIAKQVTQANCLFASQVREIMMLFTFEQTKLDYAKFAYPYTFDKGNYFKVHDAFQFESSIEDLNQHIGAH